MNYCKAPLYTVLLFTLGLAACGGDSGSSPGRDDDPSSSSSSQGGSSSSSVEDPNDSTRAATWADLEPVMDIGDEMGLSVRYVLGKNGVFSKVYLSGSSVVGQISGLYVLESDGSMRADTSRLGALSNSDGPGGNAFLADMKSSPSRLFRVHKTSGVLYAGKDRSSWKAVQAATLNTSEKYASSRAQVQGLYVRTAGDTNSTYRLYDDGTYVRTGRGVDTLWEAGYYDVQNQYLITVAVSLYAVKDPLSTVNIIAANATGSWSLDGKTTQIFAKSALASSVVQSTLPGIWKYSGGERIWKLQLAENGSAALTVDTTAVAVSQALYTHSAPWQLFGDFLLLDFQSNVATCTAPYAGKNPTTGQAYCYTDVLAAVSQLGDSLLLSQGSIPASWGK